MTDKTMHWIADPEGVKARVLDAEAADYWVRARGWSATAEPTGLEFVHVRNADHGGWGVLNYAAAQLHAGLGWQLAGPPGYDDPAPAGTKSAPKSATSGDKKE